MCKRVSVCEGCVCKGVCARDGGCLCERVSVCEGWVCKGWGCEGGVCARG